MVTSSARSPSACAATTRVEIVSGLSEGDVVVTKVTASTGTGVGTGTSGRLVVASVVAPVAASS